MVKNSTSHVKQVILERPTDNSWRLVKPEPSEKTRELSRFMLTVESGKSERFVVVEEHDLSEVIMLATLTPENLELILRTPAASPELKKALEGAMDRKSAAAESRGRRVAAEERLVAVAADQDRVRKNLQAVSVDKADEPFAEENRNLSQELLKRYLAKLAESENELEKLRSGLEKLREEELQANATFETYLRDLIVEKTE